MLEARAEFRRKCVAAKAVQSWWRGIVACREAKALLKKKKAAIIIMQKTARMWFDRHRYLASQTIAKLAGAGARAYMARKSYTALIVEKRNAEAEELRKKGMEVKAVEMPVQPKPPPPSSPRPKKVKEDPNSWRKGPIIIDMLSDLIEDSKNFLNSFLLLLYFGCIFLLDSC